MRVVSLLPAATEIVAALGQLDQLVGISHECDYPPAATVRPRLTRCAIHNADQSSEDIDRWVRETLAAGGTLYSIDESLLRDLAPDVILTQRLCDVCAVGFGSVQALAASLPKPPRLVNLEPSCLTDMFSNVRSVAQALAVERRGEEVIAKLEQRVAAVRGQLADVTHRPTCLLLEWIDPPFSSGHWGPELVELAGGHEPLGKKANHSTQVAWESVLAAQPEIIVLACCGYSVQRTLADLPILQQRAGWYNLPAVRSNRVYAVDGNAYFNRPGPRLVDSLEILAEIIHPQIFAGQFADRGGWSMAAATAAR